MPRYYFHSEDGVRFCDEEGAELEGPAAARREAIRLLGESLRTDPELLAHGRFRIEVTDERSQPLLTVTATIASD